MRFDGPLEVSVQKSSADAELPLWWTNIVKIESSVGAE
jgi:hypothetical protein